MSFLPDEIEVNLKLTSCFVLTGLILIGPGGSLLAQNGDANDSGIRWATEMPKSAIEPFLKTHCIRCHGPQKQNGQVRFDEIVWKINNNDTAQRWQDVLDMLNGGDMPPEDEPQPDSAELAKVLDSLTTTLVTARQRLTDQGGEIVLRRLNRREYANTIRDLFGFEIDPLDVPPDNDSETFDTVGSDQSFTSSHFERYLELGERIATEAFRLGATPRKSAKTWHGEVGHIAAKHKRRELEKLARQMAMKKAGATWKEIGFKDEGEMEIVFGQWEGRFERPSRYLEMPLVDEGLYLSDIGPAFSRANLNRPADPRGTYRVRIRGGIHGEQPEIRKFVTMSIGDRGVIGVLKIDGTTENPEVVETTVRTRLGEKSMTLQFREDRSTRRLDAYVRALKSKGPQHSIWIDWLELEGPFYNDERSFFETLTFKDDSRRGRPELAFSDESAREWIKRFTFEAFRRRKPAPAYLDGLVTIYESRRQEGLSIEESMSAVVSVILSSPGFLYLQEQVEPENDGKKLLLDHRELAERLAYFLWSSPPDAALYARVDDGTLSRDAVLRAEVDRMLADPKAAAFYQGFASQWGDLERFQAVTVDENKFKRFNAAVRNSASRELSAFFKTLVEENLPAANLIDSDFVVIDPLLAQHYGIDGVHSNAFQKVPLAETSPRGGLLGQMAFLTAGSNGERSSPVIRGALVMQKLLHDKPAPPPPNVPELGAEAGVNRTNRELVEFHQRKPQCASCHKKMDVIGFGLENFDTIGRWRETERVANKNVPIAPGGQLPDGGEFANLDDLKQLLLDHDERLAKELVESLLAYGIGRNIEFSDTEAVEAILAQLKPDQFRLRAMIREIAASRVFRSK